MTQRQRTIVQQAAGILMITIIGVSGLLTFPGGGYAVRDDGLETAIYPPSPGRAVAAETAEEGPEGAATPAFLVIPSIRVSAVIEQAGLTDAGAMEKPTTWDTVGWYKYGVKPGDQGSAVIAGHLDSETDTAVFWDLQKLQAGDEVKVIDTHGVARTFIVSQKKEYGLDDVPMKDIFRTDGPSRIVLITCDGEWRGAAGYDRRLAVYAELAA